MLTSEILIRAKHELVTRGWHQGFYKSARTGRVCALGAINLAATEGRLWEICRYEPEYDDPAVVAAWGLFDEVATGQPAMNGDHVPDWNDAPERTQQEVLDAFDAAIAIALAQERGSDETTDVADDPRPARAVREDIGEPVLSIRAESSF
jgi:hypothetical protein